MKVLIVSAQYYPQKNGVQAVTQYQAEGLAALGHEVTVITSLQHSPQKHEIHNGVEIFRVNCYTDFMLYFGDKKAYLDMLWEKAEKFDVLLCICLQSWVTDLMLPIINELNIPKMLLTHGIHDFRWSNFQDKSVYGLARKLWGDIRWRPYFWKNWNNIKSFDVIAHLHEKDFAAQYFKKHGVEKQEILCNAVEDELFVETTDKINRIINVGTYSNNKNQIKCLKAFYAANLPQWSLVLIGSSKNKYYQKAVECKKQLDKKCGYRNVEIYAGISRQETVEAIKKSKIYLLTSISEKFPVSLIEAMAAGCAWVSTDVGINRYLPGGKIADTPKDIAKNLENLAVSSTQNTLAEQAREFAVQHCQKAKQIQCLEKMLLEAVNNGKKSV